MSATTRRPLTTSVHFYGILELLRLCAFSLFPFLFWHDEGVARQATMRTVSSLVKLEGGKLVEGMASLGVW